MINSIEELEENIERLNRLNKGKLLSNELYGKLTAYKEVLGLVKNLNIQRVVFSEERAEVCASYNKCWAINKNKIKCMGENKCYHKQT
jgi:hypothetical protein